MLKSSKFYGGIMVTIGMNYDVIPGKEKTFEDAFKKVLGVMATMPGHSSSQLYRDVSKPGSYLIVSDWNSKEAFSEFISSKQFADVTTWGKEQILSGRPRHKVYAQG